MKLVSFDHQLGRFLLFPILALAISACSGSSSSSGAAAGGSRIGGPGADKVAVDSCGLVTETEIVAAIGEPVDHVETSSTAEGVEVCHYFGKDSAVLQRGITIVVSVDGLAKERWENHRALVSDAVSVMGIGSEAFTSLGDPNFIQVYQDKVYLSVSPLYVGSGVTLSSIETLVKKALSRALTL